MTLSGGRPEPFCGGFDDAAVGLMRDVEIEVGARQAVALEHPQRDLLALLDRELEDGLPVLLHEVQPLVDRLVRRRPPAAAGRHLQRLAAGAGDLVREVDDRRLVGSVAGDSTTAPAPSPNRMHVARSV